MCGIAGFISTRESPSVREDVVRRMNAALVHRGPDDEGLVTAGEATLGMRRLAIFDPANGHQPMVSPDGRHVLVFNGALYNHREWRERLAGRWTFRSACDTEVLLAALILHGPGVLPALRGMYAFALWDNHEKSLLLARDPLGIKPLYLHTEPDGGLRFASETRALRTTLAVPPSPDPEAVAQFLAWLAVPAPLTLWQGIRALRPGETFVWRDTRPPETALIGLGELWSEAVTPAATEEAFQEELRSRLEDTMRAHQLADVPVGAFLSGGLDSAVVAAFMQTTGAGRLKTFTIGFDDDAHSEAAEAADNARHLGTAHHTEIVSGSQVADHIETILDSLDQPSGDGINTYLASQAARRGGVTVALSGLGADELFGGYPSFRRVPRLRAPHAALALLPAGLRHALVAPLRLGGTTARKLAGALASGGGITALALQQRRVLDEATLRDLLGPGLRTPHPASERLAQESAEQETLGAVSDAEIRGYMTDVLLHDSDAMSMAHSLELRVPFVDAPLVHWLRNQPARFRFDPLTPKGALKRATHDRIPSALLKRPKRGFTPPFPRWMRGQLRPFLETLFSPESLRRQDLLNPAAATRMWTRFRDGHEDVAWSRVWSVAVLIHFLK